MSLFLCVRQQYNENIGLRVGQGISNTLCKSGTQVGALLKRGRLMSSQIFFTTINVGFSFQGVAMDTQTVPQKVLQIHYTTSLFMNTFLNWLATLRSFNNQFYWKPKKIMCACPL